MSLFSRLNILPPFVANVKSIYLSIRHKHDVWRGHLFEVWALCVLKSLFFFYLHLASPSLNHLVHNRNIKMNKWPNYFCGINNTLTVVAKLLQRLKASWSRADFLSTESQAVISLCRLVDILKQPGDSPQSKSN